MYNLQPTWQYIFYPLNMVTTELYFLCFWVTTIDKVDFDWGKEENQRDKQFEVDISQMGNATQLRLQST